MLSAKTEKASCGKRADRFHQGRYTESLNAFTGRVFIFMLDHLVDTMQIQG